MGPTALPSSIRTQLLARRSRYAPRQPLTCPAEDSPAAFAGLGAPAWAGECRRPSLVAAVELPGGHLCSRPRVSAAAASEPRTAPALCPPPPPAPPGVVPGAPHPGPAPPLPRSPQPGPRRLRADLGEQLGGSPTSPPLAAAATASAASAASLLPPCFVLPSTLWNQPTRRSGPSSGAGRGGAVSWGSPEEAASEGREAGTGFSGSWTRLPSPSPSPHPAPVLPQKRCVVLPLLKEFLELLGTQNLSFNIDMP